MNSFKMFWLQNKKFIIGLFIANILVILLNILVTGLVSEGHSLTYPTPSYRFALLMLPAINVITTITVVTIPAFIIILNLIGKRRNIILKYHGKIAYLKYNLLLNLMLYLFMIIFILINYYINETGWILIGRPDKTLFEVIPSFVRVFKYFIHVTELYLIFSGLFYTMYLTVRGLLFDSKYKYAKSRVRMFVVLKKMVMYVFIVIFFVYSIFLINDNVINNWTFTAKYLSIYTYEYDVYNILSNIVTLVMFLVVYVLVVIDYIKVFSNEQFL